MVTEMLPTSNCLVINNNTVLKVNADSVKMDKIHPFFIL